MRKARSVQVKKINHGEAPMDGTVLNQAQEIVTRILVLGGGEHQSSCLAHTVHTCTGKMRGCAGGLLIGLAFGLLTRLSLKIMHSKGHKAPEQLALTLAMAYLCFYIANSPCELLAA